MHPTQLFQTLGVPPLLSSNPYSASSFPSLQHLANPTFYHTPRRAPVTAPHPGYVISASATPERKTKATGTPHAKSRSRSLLHPSPIEFYDLKSPYFEFSNRSPHPIIVRDLCYPTAEHYWLSSQYIDYMPDIAELIRTMPTVKLAAEFAGKYAHLRNPDWNPGKELYKAMERKFKQYGHLADMLVRTGRRPLVYANPNDRFWGYDGSKQIGKNMFGMYLSNVRDYLRSEGFTKDISPILITDRRRDPYFGLTTFSDHPVADDSGNVYRTAEHLLQALRFPDDDEMRDHIREQLWHSSPQMVQAEADKYSHRGRSDWDDDVVLRENLVNVLTLKISQHRDLLELLEDTGDRELYRVGPNRYWHHVDGSGENQYGEILTTIRQAMQNNLRSYGLTSVRQLEGVDAPGQHHVLHFSNEPAGLHHYLSNFFVAPISDGKGRHYNTAEHLFQALRFRHDEAMFDYIRAQPSALGARQEAEKHCGRQRADWNEVRRDVMDWVIQMRTYHHPDFADALDATQSAELVLDDPEDTFWSTGSDGIGRNEMGGALMRVRQWLRDRRPRGDEHDEYDDED
ncbi:unnamed protein product [Peniophora sp. CBMAI 1063]|nr:unnamed protein product [Peniophora sp. CBMAI 1063]